MACQGQNAHPPLYEGLSGALAHNGLSIHQADKQIGRGLCPIFPGGARGINPAMSIGTRTVWDTLARLDPLLATEGYNACEGYRSREELGTLASAEAGFSPAAGERVLDLGCGWGKMTRSLAASGALPLGLDISTEMLRNCRRHSGVDQLVCAQADRLPLRSDAFDKVWSHSMLMHLSRQQVALVIAEVARVLRPGGAACLHFKNRRHPSELLLALRAAWTGGSRHPQRRRGVDPGWLARTARQHFGEVRLVAESFCPPTGATWAASASRPATRSASATCCRNSAARRRAACSTGCGIARTPAGPSSRNSPRNSCWSSRTPGAEACLTVAGNPRCSPCLR